ncbi:hypothetical protein ACIA8G_32960 [Lentzea sp. NPDC051213]|uniref:hypothetical protein n=1 Tax=Lentzea sp. NPDC051213 TaxID=3364126 RepID=UPI0037A67335
MTEAERSSKGADTRTVLQAALLVLGTGMTLLIGYVNSGAQGVVGAMFIAGMFLAIYYSLNKGKPTTNGRIIWLAVCVGVTLLVFLSMTLSAR